MMELFIELLLETLADLRGSERKDFIKILKKKYFLLIPLSLFEMSDLQHTVLLMVQTYGRQSVEKIVEVLKEMKRTDLAQRLTESSSEAQNKHLDEHLFALIHKVATMAAVKDLLVETLEDLSELDLMKFKTFLQFTRFQKSLPQIELTDDRRQIVNDMIDKLGQQSVEVIREVLTDMKRTDLVQRLSESSSGLRVGMLRTLEGQNGFELRCGSHVDRLLSKMPPSYRDGFVEHCLNQGILWTGTDQTYTLPDVSSWLQMKSQAKCIAGRAASLYSPEAYKPTKKDQRLPNKPKEKSTAFFLTSRETPSSEGSSVRPKSSSRPKPYCPRCENKEHFLNACVEFKKLTTNQMVRWLTDEQRCWKCGRTHQPEVCTLKRPCNTCREQQHREEDG